MNSDRVHGFRTGSESARHERWSGICIWAAARRLRSKKVAEQRVGT